MNRKRDYYEDIQLFSSPMTLFWTTLLLIGLALFPKLAGNYYIYVANLIAINSLVAIGLNLLVGYAGQISLGHGGFFAIGAYTCVILMTRYSIPFVLALPLAGFVAAAFGFLLGLPSLRLEGPYLAIATLGFGMAVIQILGHWDYVGGHMGISTPRISIGPLVLKSDRQLYYLIMLLTVIMTVGGRNLARTRIGRAFIAIRDSDIAAATLGVNLTYYKTLAFAISAFYTGIAGGLMAFVLGFINPGSFTLTLSITFLAMIVVGGLGSIPGSILGAIFLTLVQLKLNTIQETALIGPFLIRISEKWFTVGGLPNIQNILLGLLMILIILFEPLGLYGIWKRIQRFWQTWPF